MWCNQIFSLISGDTIQNIIVVDNYELANQIARIQYGDDAIAVDSTFYPVSIGYKYIDGIFYKEDGVTVIPHNPTEAERIAAMELHQAETEVDVDFRLSFLELGLD